MLRGQEILHPAKKEDGSPDKGKLWPMPPDPDLRKAFQSYERDAFAGNAKARNAMYQATLAIYAAKSVDAGDSSAVIDLKRMEESAELAIGKVESYNGRATVLPYGHDYAMFRDGLARRLQDVVDSGRMVSEKTGKKGEFTGAGVDWMSRMLDMPLKPIGDGVYVLRAGNGVQVDKNYAPVVINFNDSAAYRFKGEQPPAPPTPSEIEGASQAVPGRAFKVGGRRKETP